MEERKLVAIPGQAICGADKQHIPGRGTYVLGNHIFSSTLGTVVVTSQSDGTCVVEVLRGPLASKGEDIYVVPAPGGIVTARVISVEEDEVLCELLCLGKTDISSSKFKGFIESGDARSFERDRVRLGDCFRSGDLILARVADVVEDVEDEDGDPINDEDCGLEEDVEGMMKFQLSTAEPELGVVSATSECGGKLIPISWCEMQCVESKLVERRKVAKVVPERFEESRWKTAGLVLA